MPKIRPEGELNLGTYLGRFFDQCPRIYFCVIKSCFMIVGLRKIINSVGVYLMVLGLKNFSPKIRDIAQ